jgi:hypothetical protein
MRSMKSQQFWLLICLACLPAKLCGQPTSIARQSVALEDPARPPWVRVKLTNGDLAVMGHEGSEVVVECIGQGPQAQDKPAGLSITQADNVVNISMPPDALALQWRVRVPSASRLTLNDQANGNLRVEQISGEIEVNLVNGNLAVTQVTGSVVAHAVNGNMTVDFAPATRDKPTVLTSVNGRIQVILPENFKANLKLETMNGHIDCQVTSTPEAPPGKTPGPSAKSSRIMPGLPGKIIKATLNGGGPSLAIKTVNGSIQVRKKR